MDDERYKMPIDKILELIKKDLEEYIEYEEAKAKEKEKEAEEKAKKLAKAKGAIKKSEKTATKSQESNAKTKNSSGEAKTPPYGAPQTEINPEWKHLVERYTPRVSRDWRYPPSYVVDQEMRRVQKELKDSYEFYKKMRDKYTSKSSVFAMGNPFKSSAYMRDLYPITAKKGSNNEQRQNDNKPSTSKGKIEGLQDTFQFPEIKFPESLRKFIEEK